MAAPRCWSRTLGTQRGARVRVYERKPGGPLQASIWLPGSGESRRSLGHRDKDRAVQQAREVLQLHRRRKGKPGEPSPLTLGKLFGRYLEEGKYLPDGSLKTDPYLRHIAAAGQNLTSHFGEDSSIAELTPDRLQVYIRLRREGIVTGHQVRTNAIQRELTILKGALNWARGVNEHGRPLLASHPLEAFKIPSERDPKRPTVDDTTVTGLVAVADQVHPYLATLIVVARTTGRRLSAVLGLHWTDLNFDRGEIRWRAENDKLRRTSVVPASRAALEALAQFRAIQPGLGQVPVFPHPKQ